MSHGLRRASLICGLVLVSSISAAAQVAMPDGNPQRSRVFVTRSLDAPPQLLLWKLEKLFRLRFSEEVTGQNGPFTIRGSIPTFQHFTTPIVSDGVIFFKVYMIDSYLFAVDAATGKQIVTLKFDKSALSTPAAAGTTVFFGTSTGRVYAYDVTTRKNVWAFEQKGAYFSDAEPVIVDGVIYLCGIESGVYALDAGTGALKWWFKFDKPLTGPAVQGEHVVVLSNKTLIALDRKTGTKKWEAEVGREFEGPSVLGEQIFVTHESGEIRAHALADGAFKWKAKIAGGAETALALFKDVVIYGEEYGSVVALDAQTGAEKWRFKTKKTCRDPLIAGATVYARCDDEYLYALDPETGALKWSSNTKARGRTPTIANGALYFLSSEGTLQAIQ